MPFSSRAAATLCLTAITSSLATAQCPQFTDGEQVGTLAHASLDEVSGMAESWKTPGIFWVHNDQTTNANEGIPRFFAILRNGGFRAEYRLSGVTMIDWEDIAVGPGTDPEKSYVYIADTGDNDEQRAELLVYTFEEPDVPLNVPFTPLAVTDFSTLRVKFPGSDKYDVESLVCDPATSDLYFITRDRDPKQGETTTRAFRKSAPHVSGALTTMTLVASWKTTQSLSAKAAAFSRDGLELNILFHNNNSTLTQSHIFTRTATTSTVASMFTTAPCVMTLESLIQAEAIAYEGATGGFLVTSEERNQPIHFYGRKRSGLWMIN